MSIHKRNTNQNKLKTSVMHAKQGARTHPQSRRRTQRRHHRGQAAAAGARTPLAPPLSSSLTAVTAFETCPCLTELARARAARAARAQRQNRIVPVAQRQPAAAGFVGTHPVPPLADLQHREGSRAAPHRGGRRGKRTHQRVGFAIAVCIRVRVAPLLLCPCWHRRGSGYGYARRLQRRLQALVVLHQDLHWHVCAAGSGGSAGTRRRRSY